MVQSVVVQVNRDRLTRVGAFVEFDLDVDEARFGRNLNFLLPYDALADGDGRMGDGRLALCWRELLVAKCALEHSSGLDWLQQNRGSTGVIALRCDHLELLGFDPDAGAPDAARRAMRHKRVLVGRRFKPVSIVGKPDGFGGVGACVCAAATGQSRDGE